jgi:hypothetical protein
MNCSVSIQITNSGFEFHMMPASGEAVTNRTQGQQWERNETLPAATNQTVSFTCSLNSRHGFEYLD